MERTDRVNQRTNNLLGQNIKQIRIEQGLRNRDIIAKLQYLSSVADSVHHNSSDIQPAQSPAPSNSTVLYNPALWYLILWNSYQDTEFCGPRVQNSSYCVLWSPCPQFNYCGIWFSTYLVQWLLSDLHHTFHQNMVDTQIHIMLSFLS